MKRILYLHTGAELYGADIVLLTLLEGLDKTRYEPIVVLPLEGPLVAKLKAINIEVHIIDYPILRRQYFTPKGLIDYLLKYCGSCNAIIELVKNRHIDMIHVNTIAVLEGIYISRKIKVPLIWHVHEILENPKVVYKATSFLMGRFATKIVTVSNAVKNHLLKSRYIKEEKIEVIYNGVNTDKFNSSINTKTLRQELSIPEDAFIVGMIGRVNAIKGQDEFIKIVSTLIGKYKNIYGIIVGDAFPGQEWRVTELKQLIKDSNCSDNFRYLGYRTDSNVLHNLFDVYVLPSVSADSLPTVVLEAMACEKVVVGYKNGGICEMVSDRESGYLEVIGANEKLSDDIEEIYLNDELYKSMAKCSAKRLNNMFSLHMFHKKIDDLYQRV
ncbi:glycosyltransferase family 4 protein [Blautia sp. BX19]|nr:glycosyltransferase family 4 protein [Blautia tarda]